VQFFLSPSLRYTFCAYSPKTLRISETLGITFGARVFGKDDVLVLHSWLFYDRISSLLSMKWFGIFREIIKARSRQYEHTSQCDGSALLTRERWFPFIDYRLYQDRSRSMWQAGCGTGYQNGTNRSHYAECGNLCQSQFQDKGADTVYAFQTRNPTHSGHAYLMKSARQDLRNKGYQNPVCG
jgi:hypothetical protein